MNRGVQVLKLKNNNLKSDGVLILADGIRDNTALKELYLDHNEIGNHGAAGLAQVQFQLSLIPKMRKFAPTHNFTVFTSCSYSYS